MNGSPVIKLLEPFYHIFTVPPQQWHPLLIHFPIVFLILETVFLILFLLRRKTDFEKGAYIFLKAAFGSIWVVAATGFHDCALNMGEGNKFLLGLQDRLKGAFNFDSSVTIHFWLALLLFAMTSFRFLWRWRKGPQALQGKSAWIYGIFTFLGIWCLLAASYVGGLMSHD